MIGVRCRSNLDISRRTIKSPGDVGVLRNHRAFVTNDLILGAGVVGTNAARAVLGLGATV